MSRKSLSELESCVLGLIWREGPLTAYQTRMSFLRSSTTSWRASTGSIYPLIRKLQKQGLITTRSIPKSRRNAKLLEVTKSGIASIKGWVSDMPDWIGDPIADPIRTRFYFLNTLSKAKQKPVLAKWRIKTNENISKITTEMRASAKEGDEIEVAALKGVLLHLKARAKWLETLVEG
jgi:DNA-binding PadR family transcriptional regulator